VHEQEGNALDPFKALQHPRAPSALMHVSGLHEPDSGECFDVAVAGAGVAGLGCAAALAGVGLRVAVCERAAHAGGRAASWLDEQTGTRVDIGPHVITSEHRNYLALLQRVGTAQQIVWQPEPLITLLDADRVLRMRAPAWPTPLHGLANLRQALCCVSPLDLLSNARVAWAAARLTPPELRRLDGVDARSYLVSMGVSERFIQWFWTSAMLALLNVPLARCSAASVMRVFRLMLGRSGYCFGFPRIALADLFVPGCRRMVEQAGGQLRLGEQVCGIAVDQGRFAGFMLSGGRMLRATAGVLALPPQALTDLVRNDPAVAAAFAAARPDWFAPSPYVSMLLWLDRKVTAERFWARVHAPQDLNTDFYDLANIRDDLEGGPSVIASNAIHVPEAHRLDDAHLVQRTRNELAQFAPQARQAHVLHARVHRIPMAVPSAAPGNESLRPPAASSLPGLFVAGDWTDTGLPFSMESAARSGALAAEAVGNAAGRSLRVALEPPGTTGLIAWLGKRG
jgi:15-cis-phytoene desaturase